MFSPFFFRGAGPLVRGSNPFRPEVTVGGSGDACIIRCFDGVSTYFAKRRADETAVFAGLRRVENFVTVADPADAAWIKTASGSGVAPVVDASWYTGPDGSASARRVTFSTGGGTLATDRSTLLFKLSAKGQSVASCWLRLVSGGPKISIAPNEGGTGVRIVTLPAGQWVRVMSDNTASTLNEPTVGIRLRVDGSMGNTDPTVVEIAAGPSHAPQVEYSVPLGAVASENVAPNSVRYFSWQNPFSVDSGGVVTDTGQRTPISGGGLIVPGAETLLARSARFTEDLGTGTQWATISAQTVVALGAGYFGPFVADDITSDGVNTCGVQKTVLSSANNELIEMRLDVSKNIGLIRFGIYNNINIGRRAVVDTNAGTRVDWDGAGDPDLGFYVEDYGDWRRFVLRTQATQTGSPYLAQIFARASDGAKTWRCRAEVYPAHVPLALSMQSVTGPVSRNADIAEARFRRNTTLNVSWTLDTRYGVPIGRLLTLVDANDAEVGHVDLTSAGNLQVVQGATTWTSANAVPGGQAAVKVALSAGSGGVRASIAGNVETAATPTFDFIAATDAFVGHDAAGSNHSNAVGTPVWGYRP